MTKATPLIRFVSLIALGAVVLGFITACNDGKVAIGQQHHDGQAPDGMLATGGGGTITGGGIATGGIMGSGGTITGGGIATGGIVGSGGTITGGVITTGGRLATGGRVTGGTVTGGIVATGGIVSGGVTRTGGAGGLTTGGVRMDAGIDTHVSQDVPQNPDLAITTLACTALTTQADCDARGDCHSVFVDPGTCGCASPGCCAKFNQCAVGGRAACQPPNPANLCDAPTPFCESPYVVAYTSNSCYEGCVRQTACAGTDAGVALSPCPTTAPTNGSPCEPTGLSCFYDTCPGTGRTQALCAGSSWSVQTGACGAVGCIGYPNTTFTCASGSVCIVRAGGAITADCAANDCAAGPVSDQCIPLAKGCTLSATLASGVTFTCNTCPQGGCP